MHANWSHDGSKFASGGARRAGRERVDADADGTKPTERAACQADPCAQLSYPSFSPDDSHLLVTRYDLADDGQWGPSHLVLVDLDTGKQTVIASTADGTTRSTTQACPPTAPRSPQRWSTTRMLGRVNARGARSSWSTPTPARMASLPHHRAGPLRRVPTMAPNPGPHPLRILEPRRFPGEEEWQLYTVASDGTDLAQVTTVDYGMAKRRPGSANWTPDGAQIIASVGVVDEGRVVDVKIAYIDPNTGSIRETKASGAGPGSSNRESTHCRCGGET